MKVEAPKEEPITVPIWILSFGDMVTNLMACFVMLVSMASSRESGLFQAGMGSFRRIIQSYGMPAWLGEREGALLGRDYLKMKYPTEEDDSEEVRPTRVINPEDDAIRKLYEDLTKAADSQASDQREELLAVRTTPILFAPGQADLSAEARRYLDDVVVDLRQSLAHRAVRVCVVATPAGEPAGPASWLLAARRAGAVEEHLARAIQPELERGLWQVSSQGRGPGAAAASRGAGRLEGGPISLVILARKGG